MIFFLFTRRLKSWRCRMDTARSGGSSADLCGALSRIPQKSIHILVTHLGKSGSLGLTGALPMVCRTKRRYSVGLLEEKNIFIRFFSTFLRKKLTWEASGRPLDFQTLPPRTARPRSSRSRSRRRGRTWWSPGGPWKGKTGFSPHKLTDFRPPIFFFRKPKPCSTFRTPWRQTLSGTPRPASPAGGGPAPGTWWRRWRPTGDCFCKIS